MTTLYQPYPPHDPLSSFGSHANSNVPVWSTSPTPLNIPSRYAASSAPYRRPSGQYPVHSPVHSQLGDDDEDEDDEDEEEEDEEDAVAEHPARNMTVLTGDPWRSPAFARYVRKPGLIWSVDGAEDDQDDDEEYEDEDDDDEDEDEEESDEEEEYEDVHDDDEEEDDTEWEHERERGRRRSSSRLPSRYHDPRARRSASAPAPPTTTSAESARRRDASSPLSDPGVLQDRRGRGSSTGRATSDGSSLSERPERGKGDRETRGRRRASSETASMDDAQRRKLRDWGKKKQRIRERGQSEPPTTTRADTELPLEIGLDGKPFEPVSTDNPDSQYLMSGALPVDTTTPATTKRVRSSSTPPDSKYMMSGALPVETTTPATTTPARSSSAPPSSRSQQTATAPSRPRRRDSESSEKHKRSRRRSTEKPESTTGEKARSKPRPKEGDTAKTGHSSRDTKSPSSTSPSTSKGPTSSRSKSPSSASRDVDKRWKQLAATTSKASSLFDLSSSLYGLDEKSKKAIPDEHQSWITDQIRKRIGALKVGEKTDLTTALESGSTDWESKLTVKEVASSLLKPMRDFRTQRYTKALNGDDDSAKSKAKEGMKKEESRYAAAMKSVQGLASAATAAGTQRRLLYRETRVIEDQGNGKDLVTTTRTDVDGRVLGVTTKLQDALPPEQEAKKETATATATQSGGTKQKIDDFVLEWWKRQMEGLV